MDIATITPGRGESAELARKLLDIAERLGYGRRSVKVVMYGFEVPLEVAYALAAEADAPVPAPARAPVPPRAPAREVTLDEAAAAVKVVRREGARDDSEWQAGLDAQNAELAALESAGAPMAYADTDAIPEDAIAPLRYSAEVRRWAKEAGHKVGDRGRLHDDIVRAFLTR